MNLLLNLAWLVLGGFIAGMGWILAAILCCLSIVLIPWAGAAFKIGLYTLFPFGQQAVRRERLTGREDLGTGPFGVLLNLLWLIFGIPLAIAHLLAVIPCAVTIIGLPFAWAHLKLAGLALWPIGTEIVSNETAESLRYGFMRR